MNKMKRLVCGALVCMTIIGLSGCDDEILLQDENEQAEGTFTLYATTEPDADSRLALGDDYLTLYWEDGDELYLVDVNGKISTKTLTTTLTEPSTTAEFTMSGAVQEGTYYVVNYDMSSDINYMDFVYKLNEKDGYYGVNKYLRVYGIVTLEEGQKSANIKLNHVYTMLRFTIIDSENKWVNENPNSRTKHLSLGMISPKTGFKTIAKLQPDGSFLETDARVPKIDLGPKQNPINTNPSSIGNDEVKDYRALLLPVDLSNDDIYFYISEFNAGNNYEDLLAQERYECVYEFVKKGKELKGGVCYNITLDMSKARKITINNAELDSPDKFRAIAYYADVSTSTLYGELNEYVVTKDIDFEGETVFPIYPGTIESVYGSYLTINGNNKTLKNLNIDWPFEGAGLISNASGTISPYYVVYDLTIENATIKGTDYVGAFCGYSDSFKTNNCHLVNSTIEGNNYVGGICGGDNDGNSVSNNIVITNCTVDEECKIIANGDFVGGIGGHIGTITDCTSAATVEGINNVGGIVGFAVSGINKCGFSGTVKGTGSHIGGIIGGTKAYAVYGTSSGSAYQCYNTGSVTGTDYVGGIMGYLANDGDIDECYSTGEIKGDDYVGGIVGYTYVGDVKHSYNLGKVNGTNHVAGIIGGCSSPETILYCYSAGEISSNIGIVGTVESTSGTLSSCVTTSPYLGYTENAEYVNLTDINSKVSVLNNEDDYKYYSKKVWDTTQYPAKCPLLLWQDSSFGVTVTSE